MIRTAIIGASGYTGLELCELLFYHPHVELTKLYSRRGNGLPITHHHKYLPRELKLPLEAFDLENPLLPENIDVLFITLPHGLSQSFLPKIIQKNSKLKIIDLSADFRLSSPDLFKKYYQCDHQAPHLLSKFIYGLPELFKRKIQSSNYIASPGCYATSVILGLYPLLPFITKKNTIIIDAKSGMSGAGKSLQESSLFCEVNEGVSSYKTGEHRHLAEMEDILGISPFFSPHIVPMQRGILSSIYIYEKLDPDTVHEAYQNSYQNHPFINLSNKGSISTAWTRRSNQCHIDYRYHQKNNVWVIQVSIDNLIKGSSGQSIQSFNIMHKFKESEGLQHYKGGC